MWLVQDKNEILSPSAKIPLRLLTLWTPSDHPYLVEVLHPHPLGRRTSVKSELQSQIPYSLVNKRMRLSLSLARKYAPIR